MPHSLLDRLLEHRCYCTVLAPQMVANLSRENDLWCRQTAREIAMSETELRDKAAVLYVARGGFCELILDDCCRSLNSCSFLGVPHDGDGRVAS